MRGFNLYDAPDLPVWTRRSATGYPRVVILGPARPWASYALTVTVARVVFATPLRVSEWARDLTARTSRRPFERPIFTR